MAGVTGLEPAASGVTGRRSNQLSYTPAGRTVWSAAVALNYGTACPCQPADAKIGATRG